uniref:Uncharacterized protein n=1 Tax=Tanacetum cinerariifolium TaxID=118510 RepID=A0A699HD85_TANCI|nr:hypothetical protein [Tanacetum cinerariifolium]
MTHLVASLTLDSAKTLCEADCILYTKESFHVVIVVATIGVVFVVMIIRAVVVVIVGVFAMVAACASRAAATLSPISYLMAA